MLSRTFGYIFSVVILLAASTASAQEDEEFVPDTTARRFIPTGVRFGPDLYSILNSYYNEKFTGWEVAADIDFYRYYLVAEYGAWASDILLDNGVYNNDGNYFRVGVDVNFLFKDPDKNMFFLGGRFGTSSYSDQLTYSYDVPEFPGSVITASNPHVVATWLELTTGLKVKVWKIFWLGATARFKFGLDLDGNGDLTSYDVPGYGLNYKPNWWGFNYYAMIRIPFRGEKEASRQMGK
jgi:hypothetical protein